MDDRGGATRRAAALAARAGAGGARVARGLLRGEPGDQQGGIAAAPVRPAHAVLSEQAYRHAREQLQLADEGQPVEPGSVPMPVCWSHPRRTEAWRDDDRPDGVLDLLDPADGRVLGALLVRLSRREQLAPTPRQVLGRVVASALSHRDDLPFPEERSYCALVDASGRLVARRRWVGHGQPDAAGHEVRDAAGTLLASCTGGRREHDWLWGDGTPAPALPVRATGRTVDLRTGRRGAVRELTRTRHGTDRDGRDWWTCDLTEHVEPHRRLAVQAVRLLPNMGCLAVER